MFQTLALMEPPLVVKIQFVYQLAMILMRYFHQSLVKCFTRLLFFSAIVKMVTPMCLTVATMWKLVLILMNVRELIFAMRMPCAITSQVVIIATVTKDLKEMVMSATTFQLVNIQCQHLNTQSQCHPVILAPTMPFVQMVFAFADKDSMGPDRTARQFVGMSIYGMDTSALRLPQMKTVSKL